MSDAFVGFEHLFQDVLTFLYTGQRSAGVTDELVATLANKLELRGVQQQQVRQARVKEETFLNNCLNCNVVSLLCLLDVFCVIDQLCKSIDN